MKAILVYVANKRLSEANHSVPIYTPGGRFTGHVAYVRLVEVEADDLCEALDRADPLDGENFVNSIPLPDDFAYLVSDWQQEVQNGDTKLGYEQWKQHQRDAED